jgi:hypothetical protein
MNDKERDYEPEVGHDVHESPQEADPSLYTRDGYVDPVEYCSRNSDYERLNGRTFVGWDNETDLGRVSMEGPGDAAAPGSADDGETVDLRYEHDTRGSRSYTGKPDGVDDEDWEEISKAGLKIGIASLDMHSVGFALANAQFMASRLQWANTPEWKRQEINEARKDKRSNRHWFQVREDSIHRQYLKHYNAYIEDRSKADPYWRFMSDDEIAHLDGIDSRSARQRALSWRFNRDDELLKAMSVKYMGLLEGVKPVSIRARYKKQPHLKDLALFVTVQDCISCGAMGTSEFDTQKLLSELGDELVEMEAAVSERDRREFIINESHAYLSKGSLFPAYCWETLDPVLSEVIKILEEAGVALSPPPEPAIDWSGEVASIERRRGWKA